MPCTLPRRRSTRESGTTVSRSERSRPHQAEVLPRVTSKRHAPRGRLVRIHPALSETTTRNAAGDWVSPGVERKSIGRSRPWAPGTGADAVSTILTARALPVSMPPPPPEIRSEHPHRSGSSHRSRLIAHPVGSAERPGNWPGTPCRRCCPGPRAAGSIAGTDAGWRARPPASRGSCAG